MTVPPDIAVNRRSFISVHGAAEIPFGGRKRASDGCPRRPDVVRRQYVCVVHSTPFEHMTFAGRCSRRCPHQPSVPALGLPNSKAMNDTAIRRGALDRALPPRRLRCRRAAPADGRWHISCRLHGLARRSAAHAQDGSSAALQFAQPAGSRGIDRASDPGSAWRSDFKCTDGRR